jgi:hypothetical protein
VGCDLEIMTLRLGARNYKSIDMADRSGVQDAEQETCGRTMCCEHIR